MFKLYAVRLFCFKHAYIQRDMMECVFVSAQQSNDVISSIFVQRLNFDLDFGFTEAGGLLYDEYISISDTKMYTHIHTIRTQCLCDTHSAQCGDVLSFSVCISFFFFSIA